MKQYFINAIRLDKENEHIEWVKVRKDGTKGSYATRRELVVHLINSGISFKTRYRDKKNEWQTGAEVEVFEKTFLRANPNTTALDNLRNLSVF
jgi:hypothetical protein